MTRDALPPVLHGVMLPTTTACGIVSRSRSQTQWAIVEARRRAREQLEHLDDADVLWLLLMGWAPAEWSSWIEHEALGPNPVEVARVVAGVVLVVCVVVLGSLWALS